MGCPVRCKIPATIVNEQAQEVARSVITLSARVSPLRETKLGLKAVSLAALFSFNLYLLLIFADQFKICCNNERVPEFGQPEFFSWLVGQPPKRQLRLLTSLRSLKGDDNYLVGVELNPGPAGGKGNNQKSAQPKKQRGGKDAINKSMQDEIARLKAELDQKTKAFNAPLEQIKMDIQIKSAELNRDRLEKEISDYNNSVTFPGIGDFPITPHVPRHSGKQLKTVHVANLDPKAIKKVFKLRGLLLTFITSGSAYCIVYLFVAIPDFTAFSIAYWCTMVCAWYFVVGSAEINKVYKRFETVRLIAVPIKEYTINDDKRPEMDRAEGLAPQKYVDMQLWVEIDCGNHFVYLNKKSEIDLPGFWFTVQRKPVLRTLKINTGLLATALNRKTLGLRTANNAQRVERAARLVSANASYQEDYESLLMRGTSSYADIQLLTGVILTGDATRNPMDF